MEQEFVNQEDRDYQLWSIAVLTLIVVSAGLAAMWFPAMVWGSQSGAPKGRYLPTLILGFITLIVLFNIYVIGQRRTLHHTRITLMKELVQAREAVAKSFIDPLTQVFNRHYMEHMIPREVKRAERLDGVLALLLIDVDDFKAVNTRVGHVKADHFLREVAQTIMATFRGSDTVFRFGGDEFLVVMPDTREDQAHIAVDRLLDAVARWNTNHPSSSYRMSLSCGVACYRTGDTIHRALELADQRMYEQKPSRRQHAGNVLA